MMHGLGEFWSLRLCEDVLKLLLSARIVGLVVVMHVKIVILGCPRRV